jgi:hypothetical protein
MHNMTFASRFTNISQWRIDISKFPVVLFDASTPFCIRLEKTGRSVYWELLIRDTRKKLSGMHICDTDREGGLIAKAELGVASDLRLVQEWIEHLENHRGESGGCLLLCQTVRQIDETRLPSIAQEVADCEGTSKVETVRIVRFEGNCERTVFYSLFRIRHKSERCPFLPS